MKNIFFALGFMLVGTFAFANNIEPNMSDEYVILFDESSEVNLKEHNIIIEFNSPSESFVSIKCWLFKKWIKGKLKEVSDDVELIDELADTLKGLCEIAKDLGWLD